MSTAPLTEGITVLDAGIVSGAGGGIEKTLIAGAPYHRQSRYRSVVALLHPKGDAAFEVLRSRASAAEVELYDRGESFPASLATVAWFAHLCRHHRVSVWHSHDYKTNAIGLLLQPAFGYSLVCTLHGWCAQSGRTNLYFALDRRMIRHFDHVIAVSPDLYDSAVALGIESDRLTLISNGVDSDFFRRRTPERTAGPVQIGAAGRLVPEKGFELLIDAVGALLDEGCDLRLTIAGDGPLRPVLDAQIRGSRYPDRMRLAGHVEDMRDFYESIDLFCLSSLREGMPNVVLEAMAMSLPIAAASVGGIPSLLEDGQDALLCSAGSGGRLADALRRLVRDPDRRSQLAIAARRRAEELSFTTRMQHLFAVYDRLNVRAT